MNQKDLFWISMTIFLTILAWMALDIYRVKNIENVGVQSCVAVTDLKIDSGVLGVLRLKKP